MQEIQETWVPSLGGDDPLEEETATPSSILARKLTESDKTEQARNDFLNSLLLVHFQASFLFLFLSIHLSPVVFTVVDEALDSISPARISPRDNTGLENQLQTGDCTSRKWNCFC